MARPVGVVGRVTKDNSGKHPHEREEWQKGKKIGRPKQEWIVVEGPGGSKAGFWRKVS